MELEPDSVVYIHEKASGINKRKEVTADFKTH